jgi:hypothetical protein
MKTETSEMKMVACAQFCKTIEMKIVVSDMKSNNCDGLVIADAVAVIANRAGTGRVIDIIEWPLE